MTLESQVVSLELAKQLKEAGYPQDESLFYWRGLKGGSVDIGPKDKDISDYLKTRISWGNSLLPCAAPTVAELGEKLSDFYLADHYRSRGVEIERKNREKLDREVESLGKMWLYLKKEGLL